VTNTHSKENEIFKFMILMITIHIIIISQ